MFDIGIQELIIIFVIALLVFGPERLPEISRKLGRWVIEIRRGVHEAKIQMDKEFNDVNATVDDDVGTLLKNVEPQAQKKEEAPTNETGKEV
ncbi:MAG: Sec-independent protein translocase protein TatB [Thermodesulfovibrionales bacterium]